MSNLLPAPNIMLEGPSGAGKTTALRSLVRAGLSLHCIFTEPHMEQIMAPLLPHEEAVGLPPLDLSKVHYMYIPPSTSSWQSFAQRAEYLNRYTWEALKKMTDDPTRNQQQGYFQLLGALANFICHHCGEQFGDVTQWGYDRALAVDGLSGINTICEQFAFGSTIFRSGPQIGAAQALELDLLGRKLCYDTKCTYVLITHVKKLFDETTGTRLLQPNIIGFAPIPDWHKNFNDVVLAVREGQKFTWSTAHADADLKARNLPVSNGLPPDFKPLLQAWWARTQAAQQRAEAERQAHLQVTGQLPRTTNEVTQQ